MAATGDGFGMSVGWWVTSDLMCHLLEATCSKSSALISTKEYSVVSVVISLMSSYFSHVLNWNPTPFRRVQRAKGTHLMILGAARTWPFALTRQKAMPRQHCEVTAQQK